MFDWSGYCDLAHQLLGRQANPTDEAKLRSAISRAYYSLYRTAGNFAVSKWGYDENVVMDKSSHDKLIFHLLRRPENLARTVGKVLKTLKEARRAADYDNDVEDLAATAVSVVDSAAKTLGWMGSKRG
jgi:uncharacterized protein (UPF0332 family)